MAASAGYLSSLALPDTSSHDHHYHHQRVPMLLSSSKDMHSAFFWNDGTNNTHPPELFKIIDQQFWPRCCAAGRCCQNNEPSSPGTHHGAELIDFDFQCRTTPVRATANAATTTRQTISHHSPAPRKTIRPSHGKSAADFVEKGPPADRAGRHRLARHCCCEWLLLLPHHLPIDSSSRPPRRPQPIPSNT
jgi:hypothetical protein